MDLPRSCPCGWKAKAGEDWLGHHCEATRRLYPSPVERAVALEREAWLWAIDEHAKECGSMSFECKKYIADKRLEWPPQGAPGAQSG